MKLPRRIDYACQVLALLGQGGGRLICLDELTRDGALPGNYLVQILNDLRSAGLVESRRGRCGGYLLARPLDQISLGQVVEAVEGRLLEVAPAEEGMPEVNEMWREMGDQLEEILAGVRLDRLQAPQDAGDWVI